MFLFHILNISQRTRETVPKHRLSAFKKNGAWAIYLVITGGRAVIHQKLVLNEITFPAKDLFVHRKKNFLFSLHTSG